MGLMLNDISDDERYDEWRRIIERIYEEHVGQGWNHYMFRLLRAVYQANDDLAERGGFVLDWLVRNYVDASLMVLRRELDRQSGTENLRNLLLDIADHPSVLTRARHKSRLSPDSVFNEGFADRTFDGYEPQRDPEDHEADFIDPSIVQSDLSGMESKVNRLRDYAERTRAHRTPERGINTEDMTFGDLHDAITETRSLIAKYYMMLTLSGPGNWEPIPQYDTLDPFLTPWVLERDRVEVLFEEEPES